eukprot:jgi/Astpho2/7425/fgenesh1_pm.00114_%23_20_t
MPGKARCTLRCCVAMPSSELLHALACYQVPSTFLSANKSTTLLQTWVQGQLDYAKLKGQTGPLVYPAGFVYAYSALRWLTNGGNIWLGQCLFAVLYLLTQVLVFHLYICSEAVPPWTLALLCLSKRMHSLFVLRLFNDCIAMLLAYAATALLVARWWAAALVAYSAAVSVKMNVLLLAPSVLVLLLKYATPKDIARGSVAGVLLQLVLGAPFLLSHPASYLSRAFELSRVFMHQWSVNFQFLQPEQFESKRLAVLLLGAHLGLLLAFAHWRWCANTGGLPHTMQNQLQPPTAVAGLMRQTSAETVLAQAHLRSLERPAFAQDALLVIFSGNFIGIVCSRTLHYQFYSWYFHMLPFLLWHGTLWLPARIGIFFCIESVWNVYPPSAESSWVLLVCHLVMLLSLWSSRAFCRPLPLPEKQT